MEEDFKFDPKSRYYDQGGIEVQEIIKAKLTPEQYIGFCLGNILKYGGRANFKGQLKRDVEKVGFYQKFLDEALSKVNATKEHPYCGNAPSMTYEDAIAAFVKYHTGNKA